MTRYFPFLLLACGALHADSNLDSRVDHLETNMQKIRVETAYGNFGARTATANPPIDGYGFLITADFLWWKLYEGGTDYLFKNKSEFYAKGDIKHFHFDWEPGFKVGIGYLLEHDGWGATIDFTYFRTHSHNHNSSSSLPSLFPLVGTQELFLFESEGHWNVHFYDIDAVLGRSYFVSKCLAFRPFFGLSSAWIQQHRHFDFTAGVIDPLILKSRNNFWGIGPRLGVDAQFFFTESLSAYGKIAGDLLWGDFHVKEFEDDTTTATEIYDLHYNLHKVVPAVAFELGAAYEIHFSKDRYGLMIKAGYETQYWWRQNQLPIFDLDSSDFRRASEDLSMQGLTVEFRFVF